MDEIVQPGFKSLEVGLAELVVPNLFAKMSEEPKPEYRWQRFALEYACGVRSHVPESVGGSGMVQSRVSFSMLLD